MRDDPEPTPSEAPASTVTVVELASGQIRTVPTDQALDASAFRPATERDLKIAGVA